METGERRWALLWVVVHRDRIQKFHYKSSFRRSGLTVYLGVACLRLPKALSCLIFVPQRGPVMTKPRQQKAGN